MAQDVIKLSLAEAQALCEAAAVNSGATAETARSLAMSVVRAEAEGQASVGLSHFIDYLDALDAGRIDGTAIAEITQPAPAIILSDAKGGAAHPGFDTAFFDLVDTARNFGLALFVQKNAFTCGALGHFVARLAEEGLVAIAATNGPPLLAGSGGKTPVFCTNPMAFGAPVAGGPPLVVDQASSATAFVSIRSAAEKGEPIPPGWALDAQGQPTTDASEAVKGTLLAFGGARGANIALMVEVLAAGLSGANWSVDAPPFGQGGEGPGTGLFVLAMAPHFVDPDFATRMAAYLDRLATDHSVHIPGKGKAHAGERAKKAGITIPLAIHARIASAASSGKN